MKTIQFHREASGLTNDPLMDRIREAARRERWSGTAGIKQWAKETYKATLRTGAYGDWTSVRFRDQAGMERFRRDFGLAEPCDTVPFRDLPPEVSLPESCKTVEMDSFLHTGL